jgi:hypothetical protein
VHKYVAVVRLKNSEPIIISLNDALEASGAHDASCIPPKKKDHDNIPAGYWVIKGKNTQVIIAEDQVAAIIVEPVVIDDSVE